MHYASPKHEKLYKNAIRGKDYSCKTLAALNARAFWENAPSSVAS